MLSLVDLALEDLRTPTRVTAVQLLGVLCRRGSGAAPCAEMSAVITHGHLRGINLEFFRNGVSTPLITGYPPIKTHLLTPVGPNFTLVKKIKAIMVEMEALVKFAGSVLRNPESERRYAAGCYMGGGPGGMMDGYKHYAITGDTWRSVPIWW